MEKRITIPLSKTKNLRGVLRGSLKKKLVVFVHGLTGNMNEHQYFNGSRFLQKRGFSTFRFNLYGGEKDERKLSECNAHVHGKDLDTVLAYFSRRGVKEFYLIGHSYGGPTIFSSKRKNVRLIVLWDPTFMLVGGMFHETPYDRSLNMHILKWAFDILIPPKMVRERGVGISATILARVKIPTKIILAGHGSSSTVVQKYKEAANENVEFISIEGANHCFDEDGKEEELFQETMKWFQKWKRG